MEVQKISELYNNITYSLNQTNSTFLNKKLFIITPKLSIRSSYARAAKYIIEYFNKTNVSIYEVISPFFEDFPAKLHEASPNIIFFIIPLYLTNCIIEMFSSSSMYENKQNPINIKTYVKWLYYKPHATVISNNDLIFLNNTFSQIFTPTRQLTDTLSQIIQCPIKYISCTASSDSFYPVNKKSARKILNIQNRLHDNSKVWLAPSGNRYESRLDIIIQAFVEILQSYPTDILILLGNPNNSDGLPIQDIYKQNLIQKEMNIEKFGKNIILLDSLQVISGIEDHLLNLFYNSADYVIFANSFSNHMYTVDEILATNNPAPIIVPRHSWFFNLENYSNNDTIFFCEPSQILYRCGSEGLDFIVHPMSLFLLMTELRAGLRQKNTITDPELRPSNKQFSSNYSSNLTEVFQECLEKFCEITTNDICETR